jgi:hypothetical protein
MESLNPLLMWLLATPIAAGGFATLWQAGKGGNPAMPGESRLKLMRSHIGLGSGQLLLAAGIFVGRFASDWGLALLAVTALLHVWGVWYVLSAKKLSQAAGIPWVSRMSRMTSLFSR